MCFFMTETVVPMASTSFSMVVMPSGRGGEGRGEFFHCLNKSAKCEGVLSFDFAKSHPRLFHSYLHTIPSTAASGP